MPRPEKSQADIVKQKARILRKTDAVKNAMQTALGKGSTPERIASSVADTKTAIKKGKALEKAADRKLRVKNVPDAKKLEIAKGLGESQKIRKEAAKRAAKLMKDTKKVVGGEGTNALRKISNKVSKAAIRKMKAFGELLPKGLGKLSGMMVPKVNPVKLRQRSAARKKKS